MLRKGVWIGLAALVAAPLPASADATGWDSAYVKLEAGHVFDWDSEVTDGAPAGATVDVDGSWVAGGGIGFYPLPQWRTEIDVSHSKADVGGAGVGDIKTTTAMLVALREFKLSDRWRGFMGGGLGAARVNPNYIAAAGTDDASWVFALQATAGLSFKVDDRWTVDARYRFLKGMDYDFFRAERDLQNHAVLGGIRYQLQPTQYEPEPPLEPISDTPPPLPPTPPPATPEDLVQLVFFRFDEDSLTPEAADVVNEVADIAMETGFIMIEAEGHADRAGPEAYNDDLSLRRANSVRNAMIARGVPGDRIRVVGKGEHEPRVPTADGVKSPANRFVKITVEF